MEQVRLHGKNKNSFRKRKPAARLGCLPSLLLEGAKSKTGVGMEFARLVNDPEGTIAELKSQFTNHTMKTLLRKHIERDLQQLDQHVQAFTPQPADFMRIEIITSGGTS